MAAAFRHATEEALSSAALSSAARRIAGHVRRTPMLQSDWVDAQLPCGARAAFKAEHLQARRSECESPSALCPLTRKRRRYRSVGASWNTQGQRPRQSNRLFIRTQTSHLRSPPILRSLDKAFCRAVAVGQTGDGQFQNPRRDQRRPLTLRRPRRCRRGYALLGQPRRRRRLRRGRCKR